MSDSVNEIYSDEDLGDAECLRETSENLNGVSSDSASTFEYVEKHLSPDKQWESRELVRSERDSFSPIETISHDDLLSARPMACSSTKEEKQRHNEEIVVMESVSASSETGSWEAVPMHEKHQEETEDVKENCRLFLRNERCFGYENAPAKSSKPCFIDASSLLDEEELIYTPPPSVCHKSYDAVNLAQLQKSFDAEDNDDVAEATAHSLTLNNLTQTKPTTYDIKDQFSAFDKPPKREQKSSQPIKFINDDGGSSRENEKHQGSLIFQHSIPQYSGHLIKQLNEDNYTSDMSIQSAYSSTSGELKELNDFVNAPSNYNSLNGNTSDYNSGYSRIQSDTDSIVLPETPFNSIVQVARQLKIFEASDGDEFIDGKVENVGQSDCERQASFPMKIPKRAMKYDEFAPVLSGGASAKDFTPKQCESPITRRKTDSCPIVSGGSIDLSEVEEKPKRRDLQKTSSSHSWVVDFNELKIHESEERQPKSLDYSSNNSLGFYVDFNSLNSCETKQIKLSDDAAKSVNRNAEAKSSKKSTGFYVDLSDSSRPETPKHVVATVKPKPASNDKKNIFSMFIDLNEGEGRIKTAKGESEAIKQTALKSNQKVEQGSSKDSNDDDKEKKGCYMFIESDSPVVKRRSLISKNDTKRHSWNVNPQEGPSEAQRTAKNYQRSTSVTNDKGIMNILEKIPILSKTSSMSMDSSVSPYEDFSCSKSFSSYSNNSATTSNSSIDQSGTKIPLDDHIMNQSLKKRRKDAKLNETFDKSSQGSITEGILSNDDSQASSTDTDDVTFQNNEEEAKIVELHQDLSNGDFKSKIMETIPEIAESSPLKKNSAMKEIEKGNDKKEELKIETHTMESLQALIEKQKQILEAETEPTSVSFVKLSDLDKPPPTQHKQFENNSMSNSAGARVSRLFHDSGHRSLTLQFDQRNANPWNMSRSTGNNFANLASSVENSKSLSRLFPHLSKVISNSVPSHVGLNSEHSFYEHLEFVSSDFSCTSSVTSSRSGMDSADESSISCRQPRRLGEDLLKMFLQEIATDVALEVGNRKMRAHKCILRSRCQYFAAILAGSWVTQAGNVISLPGYSYSAVHFALCHIYSGASHPPEGISLMELASLSDLLGLEGLKEVTAYALKTNYCHNFHKPCSGCIDGILQVLPVTLNHGLDDLYRKCLKWVCKHFNKVWLTRPFSLLPSDVHQRCRQQISAHLTSENVLNWILDCEDMLKNLEQCRWNIINVDSLVRDILDSAHTYVMDHFASLIASDSFLSLGHGENYTISRLENLFLRTAAALTPDQACRSYPRAVRLNQLLMAKVILPNPLSNESLQIMDRVNSIQLRQEDQDGWNEDFISLVSALLSAIEQCLIRQCSKAMRCSAWNRMDVDLRSKMQKLACLTDTDDLRRLRSSTSSIGSVRNYSVSSSASSRTNDLRQVKLAIQAHSRKLQGPVENSNIPVIKKTTNKPTTNIETVINGHPVTKSTTRVHVPEKPKPTHRRSHSEDVHSYLNGSKGKLTVVKSRYMEPKNPKTPVMETRANNRLQLKVKNISSSESSTRGSSPAFNRRQNIGVRKSSNLSLDSLQSPSKQRLQLSKMKNDNLELSVDSLAESMKSSLKTEKTVSSESLIKRGRNLTDETKLRNDGKGRTLDNKKVQSNVKQNAQQNNQIRKSFLSQKSREILARRSHEERKHSTNSNSSVTTKSTIPSPKLHSINKSSSSASLESKKKVFTTTLHLRKTATLSDPIDVKKTVGKVANKTGINSKVVKASSAKKPSTGKIPPEKKQVKTAAARAPIAKQEDEDEVMMKMARSNTFSKETSDNPLELLKIIN